MAEAQAADARAASAARSAAEREAAVAALATAEAEARDRVEAARKLATAWESTLHEQRQIAARSSAHVDLAPSSS